MIDSDMIRKELETTLRMIRNARSGSQASRACMRADSAIQKIREISIRSPELAKQAADALDAIKNALEN